MKTKIHVTTLFSKTTACGCKVLDVSGEILAMSVNHAEAYAQEMKEEGWGDYEVCQECKKAS